MFRSHFFCLDCFVGVLLETQADQWYSISICFDRASSFHIQPLGVMNVATKRIKPVRQANHCGLLVLKDMPTKKRSTAHWPHASNSLHIFFSSMTLSASVSLEPPILSYSESHLDADFPPICPSPQQSRVHMLRENIINLNQTSILILQPSAYEMLWPVSKGAQLSKADESAWQLRLMWLKHAFIIVCYDHVVQ